MSDPLQMILDRISVDSLRDADVEYALNRLSTAVAPEGAETEASTRFSMNKSFGAYLAAHRDASGQFDRQIKRLNQVLAERNTGAEDQVLLEIAAQSGASVSVLSALRARLKERLDTLPLTIPDWVSWVFEWLAEDENARHALLGRERTTILGTVGRKVNESLSADAVRELLPGVLAWLSGQRLREIEFALGGNPDESGQVTCLRARRLVTSIVPMGLTFVMGLVARTAAEIVEIAESTVIPHSVLECLPMAVRRGLDSPSKLAFAEIRAGFLSRVQIHQAFVEVIGAELETEVGMDYGTLVARLRKQLS